MIRYFVCSMVVAQTVAYGQSNSSNQPFSPSLDAVASPLEGIYQQVDNGLSRLQISAENLVVGTTLSLPSPSGDGTRFTPQFPQSLVYKAGEDYFWTIGTYNDAQSIFRNVEMRVRLYAENRLLDVTLLLPPDLANGGQTCLVSFDDALRNGDWGGGGGGGGGWDDDHDGHNGDGHYDGDDCGDGGHNDGGHDDGGNTENPENPGTTPDQPPQPELPPGEDPHQPQLPPDEPQQPPEQPQQPPEDPHQPQLPPDEPKPCDGSVPPQLIYVYRFERI